MARWVEQDPEASVVAIGRLMVGFRCAAFDRPCNAGSDVLDPNIEVDLHALGVRGAGPDGADVVTLELDLDLGVAIGGTKARPSVAGRVARTRSGEFLDVPAEEAL